MPRLFGSLGVDFWFCLYYYLKATVSNTCIDWESVYEGTEYMLETKTAQDSLFSADDSQVAQNFERLRFAHRTGNADLETLILLIKDAMGPRSQRKFAEDLKVNVSSISRILAGKVYEVSDLLLAKIAVFADPGSGVTLEKLMEAQGIVEAASTSDLSSKLEDNCRRIMVDELLSRGYSVSYPETSLDHRKTRAFDFEIITDAVGNGGRWLVEVKGTFGIIPGLGLFQAWLDSSMAAYYRGEKIGRISLAVDNRKIFEQSKHRLAELCIPDEISVILISTASGRVLDEYVAPLRDGRSARCVFGKEAGV